MAMSLLVILILGLVCYGVHGGRDLSNEQDLEIHATNAVQVQSLKGEYVDCVDIYKQPAFDNPLLKDTHKIQMNPSFSLEWKTDRTSSTFKYSEFDLPSKGCPKGKVPILRTKGANIHPLSDDHPGQHFATMNQNWNYSTYYGAAALINVQNPHVELNQYSAAQIWVQNGVQADLNVIQAGWGVSLNLYGDNLTRLTTQWTANGYKKTCFNVECGGFVQVDRKVFLGAKYSIDKGEQYITAIGIFQDRYTGNWWLMLNYNRPEQIVKVGYWPKQIFTSLAARATFVKYGGITFCSPDGSCPPMGSGHYASGNYQESCSFEQMKILYGNYSLASPDPSKLYEFLDDDTCYTIKYFPPPINGAKEHTFTFGGPGGKDCGI